LGARTRGPWRSGGAQGRCRPFATHQRRRSVTRALPALLLVVAASAPAHAEDALTALNDCIHKLDSSLDVGYQRIAARCPGLTPALEHGPGAAWLPGDWKKPHNQLSLDDLRELQQQLWRESGAAASGPERLHPERVHAVLERVTRPEPAQG